MNLSNKTATWLVIGLGLLLILSPVQDSFLQATPLNVAGASPSFLVLLVIWLIFGLHALACGHWLLRPIPPWMYIYFIVFVLLNLYYAASFDFEAYGENLFIKGAKIGILLAAFASVARLHYLYALPRFSLVVRVAYGVALSGILLDMASHEFWVHNIWIHGGNILNPQLVFNNRPCGFSSESSTVVLTLTALGLLCASTSRSIRARWLWVLLTFASILPAYSKAGPLLMIASFILAVFLVRGVSISQIVKILGTGTLFVMLGMLFWQGIWTFYVLGPFLNDVEAGTSVATRLTLGIGTLITVVENPWGVGLTGYLPALVQSLDLAGSYAQMLFDIPLNLSEVIGYTTQSNPSAIGTKSLFFDCLIVFGLPFGIYWIYIHVRLVKELARRQEVIPLALLIMLAGALMTYIPGVGLYPIAIAYGWLFRHASEELPSSIGVK